MPSLEPNRSELESSTNENRCKKRSTLSNLLITIGEVISCGPPILSSSYPDSLNSSSVASSVNSIDYPENTPSKRTTPTVIPEKKSDVNTTNEISYKKDASVTNECSSNMKESPSSYVDHNDSKRTCNNNTSLPATHSKKIKHEKWTTITSNSTVESKSQNSCPRRGELYQLLEDASSAHIKMSDYPSSRRRNVNNLVYVEPDEDEDLRVIRTKTVPLKRKSRRNEIDTLSSPPKIFKSLVTPSNTNKVTTSSKNKLKRRNMMKNKQRRLLIDKNALLDGPIHLDAESCTKSVAKVSPDHITPPVDCLTSDYLKRMETKLDEIYSIASCTDVDTMYMSFEHTPSHDPWYDTYCRQDRNVEAIYLPPISLGFRMPYQMPMIYIQNPNTQQGDRSARNRLKKTEDTSTSKEGTSSSGYKSLRQLAILNQKNKIQSSTSTTGVIKPESLPSLKMKNGFAQNSVIAELNNMSTERKSPRDHASTKCLKSTNLKNNNHSDEDETCNVATSVSARANKAKTPPDESSSKNLTRKYDNTSAAECKSNTQQNSFSRLQKMKCRREEGRNAMLRDAKDIADNLLQAINDNMSSIYDISVDTSDAYLHESYVPSSLVEKNSSSNVVPSTDLSQHFDLLTSASTCTNILSVLSANRRRRGFQHSNSKLVKATAPGTMSPIPPPVHVPSKDSVTNITQQVVDKETTSPISPSSCKARNGPKKRKRRSSSLSSLESSFASSSGSARGGRSSSNNKTSYFSSHGMSSRRRKRSCRR